MKIMVVMGEYPPKKANGAAKRCSNAPRRAPKSAST